MQGPDRAVAYAARELIERAVNSRGGSSGKDQKGSLASQLHMPLPHGISIPCEIHEKSLYNSSFFKYKQIRRQMNIAFRVFAKSKKLERIPSWVCIFGLAFFVCKQPMQITSHGVESEKKNRPQHRRSGPWQTFIFPGRQPVLPLTSPARPMRVSCSNFPLRIRR